MGFKTLVDDTRAAFNTGKTKDVQFRRKQLQNLMRLYEENQKELSQALKTDLNKSNVEADMTELFILKNDLNNILINLDNWTSPTKPTRDLSNILDQVLILNEPYGVILIIGAWNYPLQLCFLPIAGAIASGNCFVLKPSEVASATAEIIGELLPKYLDNSCYKVVLGGVDVNTQLLEEKFDYIFFTGSPTVGRIIHKAATKHLTPVTLELGGKSPVYVDSSADIEISAKRIIWGKFINAGQTCIAPDYVLCHKDVEKKFIECCKEALLKFYGENPEASNDLCRIINEKHFVRLLQLMNNGTIAIGGKTDYNMKYIEPTVIINVTENDPVMQEEIFGPILPVLSVSSSDEAVAFINSKEKPLALYVFSKNKSIIDKLLRDTSSGGVTVNDVTMHFTVDSLPFGGVGNSGMGAYHGKHTFDLFSHKKGVLVKDFTKIGEKLLSVRYPPYNNFKLNFLKMLLWKRNFGFKHVVPVAIAISFVLGFTASHFFNNRRKSL